MALINTEKGSTDQLAARWAQRIHAADEYFEKWEKKFKCKRLEEYYEGQQWKENDKYEPYVINLVFSSIEVKKPSLLFESPNFHIAPRPNKADFNPTEAFGVASLMEDTLNSVFSDSNLGFAEECEMSLVDFWFYFGVVEVGYGADWIKNPNAGKPILASDYREIGLPSGETLKEPAELPEKEWIYLKRIPAHRFRVGGFDSHNLKRVNWVGYYEWIRWEDLKAALGKRLEENRIEFPDGRSSEYIFDENENQISQKGDLIKVWKIWDLRAKEFLMLKDNPNLTLIKPEPFDRLPLFDIRGPKRRRGWYPIPPTFNWKGPQDEINESHEMLRSHRRKARSLYQAKEGAVDEDEINNMLVAPDMSVIKTKIPDAIKPIQNPTQDASLGAALTVSKDDFNIISATTAEQRGEGDRVTATQAQLTNARSSIRENAERMHVAKWLCAIAKETLLQIREKFTLPMWVKINSDVGDPAEAAEIQQKFALIDPQALGDFDFEVNISVESLSPLANEEEKRKLFEFLAVVQNYPLMGAVPELIREAAFRIGYKNERVIRAVIQMAQLQAMMAAGTQGGAGGNKGAPGNGQAGQNAVANATPPTLEQIRNQISGQV